MNAKTRLLQAAEKLIEDTGLKGLTMRALGASAGVSRTAAYKHFSNKTDILCAIAKKGFIELQFIFESILKAYPGAEERIQTLFKSYYRFAMDNPSCYRLMYGQVIIEQDRTPELTQSAANAYKKAMQIISDGQGKGEIKKGNPVHLTNAAWAMLHGFTISILDKQLQSPTVYPTLMKQSKKQVAEEELLIYSNILLDGLSP